MAVLKINQQKVFSLTKYLIIIFSILLIFLMTFVISPNVYGDGREYMLMTESFQNHSSPNLTEYDIHTASENYNFEFSLPIDNGKYQDGYFENKSGKYYSYHFWMYSLLVVPIKVILKTLNIDQLRCFQIFNSIIFLISIWYTYLKLKTSEINKMLIISLLIFNPIIYYLVWTHTEVFSFSFVCISLTAYVNRKYEKAIFMLSIAAMQNQPIIFLGGLYFIDYFINKYLSDRKIHVREYFIEGIKKGCCFIPFFIPIIFYYMNYGTISLIASNGYVKSNGILKKIHSLFFDINQGMFLFIPIIVIAYLFLIAKGVLEKNKNSILNIITIILIMIICSLQVNWNPGEAGIMRYNTWIIPIMIYFIIINKDVLLNIKYRDVFNKILFISSIFTFIVIVNTGIFKYKYSYIEFNPLSKVILNNYPSMYNPQEEIFAERALGREDYTENDFPIIYTDNNGNVKKVLMNNNSIDKLIGMLECDSDLILEKVKKYKNSNKPYYINFTRDEVKAKDNIIIKPENCKFEISSIDKITTLGKNNEYKIGIKVSNLGNQVWRNKFDCKDKPIGISYHWLDENDNIVIWDGNRSYLEENFLPNENRIIDLNVITPNKSGKYKLMLDIVQENVFWFSEVNYNAEKIYVNIN